MSQLGLFPKAHDAVPKVEIVRSAVFSPDRRYRFYLRRERVLSEWGKGHALWVMANPSKASGEEDDTTIRRCTGFCQNWGYGSFSVVNLAAFCATDPDVLTMAARDGVDVIGTSADPSLDNDAWIQRMAHLADLIVVAWGLALPLGPRAPKALAGRDAAVCALLAPHPLFCLGRSKSGAPRHPLMLPGDLRPEPFTP